MLPKPDAKELEETLTVTLGDLTKTVKESDKKTKKKLSASLDKMIARCEEALAQWKANKGKEAKGGLG